MDFGQLLRRATLVFAIVALGAGLTVFFVTHDIADAVFLSDHVAVLSPRPGSVRADIPIELPTPRGPHTREDPAFLAYMARVRASLSE